MKYHKDSVRYLTPTLLSDDMTRAEIAVYWNEIEFPVSFGSDEIYSMRADMPVYVLLTENDPPMIQLGGLLNVAGQDAA